MEQQAEHMTVQRGRPRLPEGERKVLMTVMVDPEQRERIERMAKKTGRGLGEIHREALAAGLDAMERKGRK